MSSNSFQDSESDNSSHIQERYKNLPIVSFYGSFTIPKTANKRKISSIAFGDNEMIKQHNISVYVNRIIKLEKKKQLKNKISLTFDMDLLYKFNLIF